MQRIKSWDNTSLHLALQKLQALGIHNCIIFQPEITIIADRTLLLKKTFEEIFSYFHAYRVSLRKGLYEQSSQLLTRILESYIQRNIGKCFCVLL